mmetsp:Transcript_11092/g.16639  ORF Transcript_11092/g.16639 Transcript_11092/m.16639 type:complete len:581 (-) Transcript_11092:24-1766(-)|eukprot:CAMPEP_0201551090 /NCGR_PEP_ID=MMETSP0173_2-20130828/7323_1 /ASSEMBLY_ACC=CAM_ASM_000268 /TAXON_ID=218659 /ORGANISM="Vexillifera sp., Strain DIVA3 564/2" /LENGTH=580 /DNA_ID=CAMNT_0047961253 /DNA_START=68 /DNA_END=1810 /DNA_ORIENTATION=-
MEIQITTIIYIILGYFLIRLLFWLKGPSIGRRLNAAEKALNPPAGYRPKGGDDKQTIRSINPATGELVKEEVVFSADDVQEVVRLSRVAQQEWSKTSWAERRAVLRDLMDLILEEQTEICRQSVEGTGKTMMEATYGEILTTLEKMRWTLNDGARYLSAQARPVPLLLRFLKKARVEYYPLGVIGIIIPGNYPFHNVASAVTTAIFSGNGAVVKVSEFANSSREYFQSVFRRVLHRRGHDPNLVAVIGGYGLTGASLIKAPCDHILFIGSPQTGQKVMASAVPSLTPVTLELGGKDPLVVFDDAEFDHAIDVALRAVFTNCGQNCIAAERIYVHANIYQRFSTEIVKRVKALRQGPSIKGGNFDCGSIAMPRQVEIVEELIQDAVAHGASVAAGGKRNNAHGDSCLFFEPTVLTNVSHDMRVVKEEAFGPIMLLLPFSTEQELIEKANSTSFALGCSLFTTDLAKAERVAKQIVSGMVTINDFGVSYLCQELPFGGVKESGFGRFNGREGLRAFCRVKSVVTDRFPIRTHAPDFVKYPIPANGVAIVSRALAMIYSSRFTSQISGCMGMLKALLSKVKQD